MNKYIKFLLFLLGTSYLLFSGCVEDPDMSGDIKNAKEPDVVLLTGSSDEYKIKRTATTITIQAEVTNANGVPVESYGICWGLESKPTIDSNKKKSIGEGLGQFIAIADNLEENCKYYLRPYATNKKGTGYGDEICVTTATGLGIVKTLQPRDIKASSIVCGGKIIDPGEGDIKERGVLLSTKPADSLAVKYPMIMETDSFYQEVSDLKSHTTYYVRAYVENAFGRFTGEEFVFTTTPGLGIVQTTKPSIEDIEPSSIVCGGIILDPGEGEIKGRGILLSTKAGDTAPKEYPITMEVDSFYQKISDLEPLTTYYIRAYVDNTFGRFFGEEIQVTTISGLGIVTTIPPMDVMSLSAIGGGKIIDPGKGEIIERGLLLSTQSDDPAPQKYPIEMEVDSFYYKITDLKPLTTYYIRAYVVNTFGRFMGDEITFTTLKGIPDFSSFKMLSRDYTSARFEAVLNMLKDVTIEECGFCFSTENEIPTLDDEKLICDIENDSVIKGEISNLKQNTPYYIRAYALNDFGVSYSGEEALQFLAKSQSPTVITHKIEEKDVNHKGIKVSGAILDQGGSEIIEAGFCWGEKENPTVLDHKIQVNKGDSLINGVITDIQGSKTYYVRAYAINSTVTSYGESKKVEMPSILTYLSDYPGLAATEVSSCVAHNQGYVLGGDLGDKRSSEMYSFDFKRKVWLSKAPSPVATKGATFVQLNDFSILKLGGIDDADSVSDAFYYYSINNNVWRQLDNSSLNVTLYEASAIAIDNEAFFFGGYSGDTINSDILKFAGWSESWKKVAKLPEKQFGSVAVTFNDSVTFVGFGKVGNSLGGDLYSKRFWSSEDMLTWEEKTLCPTKASGIICGTSANDRIYVLDTELDLWSYDYRNDSWNKEKTSFKSKIKTDNLNSIFIFAKDEDLYIGTTTGSKKFVKYSPLWDK